MMDARVIWQHDIPVRPIPKQSDHARVRAVEHAHDSPFDALALRGEARASNFDGHMIAVHRIFRGVPRDKNVTLEVRNRLVRNHKSVPVLMEHQAAANAFSTGTAARRLDFFAVSPRFVLSWLFGLQLEFSRGNLQD